MKEPNEATILGVKIVTIPLPWDQAQPMIPTIAELMSIASRDIVPLVASGRINLKADIADPIVWMTLFPTLQGVAQFLGEKDRLGMLEKKILVTTKVALPDGSGVLEWHELLKSKEREYVFDERPDLFIPCLFHAGRTTFSRFFPVRDRRGRETPEP